MLSGLSRDVRALAAARAVETACRLACYVAVTGALYAMTRSGTWVAGGMLAFYALTVLAAPAAGWVADRFDRRAVMIASVTGSAACCALMALAGSPWLLVLVCGVTAFAEAPFQPACNALLPRLTAPGTLAAANSVIGAGKNLGYLAGPLAAGAIIAAAGPAAAFWAAAGLGALSALLLLAVRPGPAPALAEPDAAADQRVTAGLRVLWADARLRRVAICWALVFCSYGLVVPGEVALAGTLHAGAAGYGLLVAAWGAGSLLGSLSGARIPARRELGALTAGCVIGAFAFALAAGTPVFWLAVAAMALGGAGEGRATVAGQLVIQRSVSDALVGRVFAASDAISNFGFAVPLLAAGAIIDLAGVRWVYALAALVCAAGALALARRDRAAGGRMTDPQTAA